MVFIIDDQKKYSKLVFVNRKIGTTHEFKQKINAHV